MILFTDEEGDMSHQKRVGIAALIWASSILLSRVIGLVREAVIGRTIGGDGTADVFWASFILPDFLKHPLRQIRKVQMNRKLRLNCRSVQRMPWCWQSMHQQTSQSNYWVRQKA